MKSSGVTAVRPGRISKRSTPASTRSGQRRSARCAARKSRPSDTVGEAFFAANAKPKWPRNTARSAPTEGAMADVAPELHAVELELVHDRVRALRRDLHLVSQGRHAQHASPGRQHLAVLLDGACVEHVHVLGDFSREAGDGVSL